MKRTTILFALFLYAYVSHSQRISPDGKYFCQEDRRLLILQSFDGKWRKEITDANAVHPFFVDGGKWAAYKRHDTLTLQQLGTSKVTTMTRIQSCAFPQNENRQWLAYRLENEPHTLRIRNLPEETDRQIENIDTYRFDEADRYVVIEGHQTTSTHDTLHTLRLLALGTGKLLNVFSSNNARVSHISFDKSGQQAAIVAQDKNGQNSIWYFNTQMTTARLALSQASNQLPPRTTISDDQTVFKFSPNGTRLFFYIDSTSVDTTNQKVHANVDVWSYTDALPQTQQIARLNRLKGSPRTKRFLCAVSTDNFQMLQINRGRERLAGRYGLNGDLEMPAVNDDYAIVFIFQGAPDENGANEPEMYVMNEYNWNKTLNADIYLESLKDGSWRLLMSGWHASTSMYPKYTLSPDGRFVAFYDEEKRDFYTYEISTGSYHKMSKKTPIQWYRGDPEGNARFYFEPSHSQLWTPDGAAWIVSDRYTDLWRLDPTGKEPPVNLTNEFGKKNGLDFEWNFQLNGLPWQNNHDLHHVVVNTRNKLNFNQGYYLADLSGANDPVKLAMGPYVYGQLDYVDNGGQTSFLFYRQSSSSPATYYYGSSLVSAKAVYFPDKKKVIGLNKELIQWKTPQSEPCAGILYKPDNFDPTRKYPTIITYYEKNAASEANRFEEISQDDKLFTASASPNIRYMTNQGYLIFRCDIHYRLGEPGPSAYDCVISGAKELLRRKYVDPKKIGIMGHSFGGYETNYLVTHSNLFAAACSGSGLTDYYGFYGLLESDRQGYNKSAALEIGQHRLGVTPWDRPDLYLKNSPIFFADRVSTPLLMMANDADERVPYEQSIELFKAFRRLGKKCWLLNYRGEQHLLDKEDNIKDWNIRLLQFFDHYLKGAPAPVWMTRGIPATMKGKTLGYEYDPAMRTPGPGLLMQNDASLTPVQKELLNHKTTVTDDGRIIDVKETDDASKLKHTSRK